MSSFESIQSKGWVSMRTFHDISPSQGQTCRIQLKSRVLLMFLWGNPIRSQLHSRSTIPDKVCLTSQSRAAVKPNPWYFFRNQPQSLRIQFAVMQKRAGKPKSYRTVSTAARSCRQRCSNFRTSHAALRHHRNSLCRFSRLERCHAKVQRSLHADACLSPKHSQRRRRR